MITRFIAFIISTCVRFFMLMLVGVMIHSWITTNADINIWGHLIMLFFTLSFARLMIIKEGPQHVLFFFGLFFGAFIGIFTGLFKSTKRNNPRRRR